MVEVRQIWEQNYRFATWRPQLGVHQQLRHFGIHPVMIQMRHLRTTSPSIKDSDGGLAAAGRPDVLARTALLRDAGAVPCKPRRQRSLENAPSWSTPSHSATLRAIFESDRWAGIEGELASEQSQ